MPFRSGHQFFSVCGLRYIALFSREKLIIALFEG